MGTGRRELVVKDILIVDSLELVHQLYPQALRHLPVRCHFASDGGEGLDLARRVGPDLILLDARLPKVDGVDVAQSLREVLGVGDAGAER